MAPEPQQPVDGPQERARRQELLAADETRNRARRLLHPPHPRPEPRPLWEGAAAEGPPRNFRLASTSQDLHVLPARTSQVR